MKNDWWRKAAARDKLTPDEKRTQRTLLKADVEAWLKAPGNKIEKVKTPSKSRKTTHPYRMNYRENSRHE